MSAANCRIIIKPVIATGKGKSALARSHDIASTARKVFDEYSEDDEEHQVEQETKHVRDAPGFG